ncbi:MAG: hypothetical protein AAGE84_29080 [Cyanobacteria bacterium P01_G01_bin.39]
MKQENILVTQSDNLSENINLGASPDGDNPVSIIVAIAILISALTGGIAKLIQVLVPVMMKDRDSQ